MDDNRIDLATDIYLKSYTRALNECHNHNLAIQCAMAVLMALIQPQNQQVNPLLSFLIQSHKDEQKKSTKKKPDDGKEGKGD